MKKYLLASFFTLSAVFSFLIAPATLAQVGQVGSSGQNPPNITDQLDAVGRAGFGATTTARSASERFVPAINSIVSFFLGFVGTIAFIVFLIGGFLWMTARGNETQVETAKKYMFNGTLGVIIIIMAYSLAFFLTEFVFTATSGSNAG